MLEDAEDNGWLPGHHQVATPVRRQREYLLSPPGTQCTTPRCALVLPLSRALEPRRVWHGA
eukprot:3822932-Pyramimonas_sp.AAC.1